MDRIADLIARMPTRQYDVVLPREAKEEFHERGFSRVGQITSDEEIDWLRELYDVMMRGEVEDTLLVRDVMVRVDEQRGDRVSQIIKPENNLPVLKQTQFWKNGRKLAAQLFDHPEEAMDGWGHMVRKAPQDDEAIRWHQDEGFWDPRYDYLATSVWMALDPATRETGCMSFIPGSHKGGVLEHQLGGGDPAVTYLEVEGIDDAGAVLQPVEVGCASLHHNRTLHMSGPNVSNQVRRAYVNEWQVPPAPRRIAHDRPWWWARDAARMALLKAA